MKKIYLIACLFLFINCKQGKKEAVVVKEVAVETSSIEYAKGFTLEKRANGITVIKITSPWPNAENSFTYALVPKEKATSVTLNTDEYNAIVQVPVERIIVTSTTHIPALEALNVDDKLIGFPSLDFISSKKTRQRIDQGLIQELGQNETLNTEIVISLNPDVVVGFGINNVNKNFETLQKSNIPVVFNGDWTEESPLGKAEWIKFFAPFFQLEKKADTIFKTIESSYNQAKLLAQKATNRPTVITGGLYKDVWYVSGGKSWMAQFLADANADYIWKNTDKTGGIPLSIESVLDKGKNAEFWMTPSMLVTYGELEKASVLYTKFDAFKNKNIYTNTLVKGETGGLVFYELAPNRPDLVLKDLIHIFHPELLKDYSPTFFKPLK